MEFKQIVYGHSVSYELSNYEVAVLNSNDIIEQYWLGITRDDFFSPRYSHSRPIKMNITIFLSMPCVYRFTFQNST